MALPKPVWTDQDLDIAWEVVRNPSSLIWNTWNEDPTKIAVLRAIVSCQVRLGRVGWFGWDIVNALAQKWVCSLHSYYLKWRKCITKLFQCNRCPENIFMSLSKHPDFWRSPVSIVPEETHEAS